MFLLFIFIIYILTQSAFHFQQFLVNCDLKQFFCDIKFYYPLLHARQIELMRLHVPNAFPDDVIPSNISHQIEIWMIFNTI